MDEKIKIQNKFDLSSISGKQWKEFYNTIGGKYICSECGQIMTWYQQDISQSKKNTWKDWLIAFGISLILTPFAGAFYLLFTSKKRGCSICKCYEIHPIDSIEGWKIFSIKHSEYIYLLFPTTNSESYK